LELYALGGRRAIPSFEAIPASQLAARLTALLSAMSGHPYVAAITL
jgi:hypothetical protein